MINKETIQKIANVLEANILRDVDEVAEKVIEILPSLGYAPPDKVIKVIGNEIEYFIEVSALEKWVEGHGYVQKAEDQRLPPVRRLLEGQSYKFKEDAFRDGALTAQQDMLKAGWVKVQKE